MIAGAPPQGLHLKIRSAYFWTIAGNLAKHSLGFVISVLLARFLEPRDYGLVGMVWVFISVLSSIQDLGFGQAIVHFNDDDSVIPTYFTVTAVLGILLTIIGFAGAPLAAAFYHEPRLIPILQVLSVTLTLASVQSVSRGLLSKHFQFREMTMIEMVSTVGAGTLGVILAWLGFGVWSLVVNLVLSFAVQSVLLSRAVPPKFTLHPRKEALPRLLRYGLPLTAASLLHQLYDNADYLVVGRMVGAAALGHYTLAFRLATLAHEKIAVIVNRVAFPSFAAMQEDLRHVVEHWFTVSRTIALVNFPILLLLFVNARDLLVVVFGEKWLPAEVPLKFLCLVGVLRSLVHLVLHIFSALGKTGMRLQFGVVNAILLPVSFAIGCQVAGLKGVGIAWCVVYPVIWLYVLYKAKTILPFSLFSYFYNLRFPILFTVACWAVMLPVDWMQQSALVKLCVRSSVGLVAFAICVLSRRSLRVQVFKLIRNPAGR